MTASRRRLYCAWIAILVLLPVSADSADNSDTQGWVEYQYRTQIRDRLQSSWGLGYRDLISTAYGISEWSRVHLRGQFLYSRSHRWGFEGGVGGYWTDQEPLDDRFEFRTWQGAILRWPSIPLAGRRFDLQSRLRLEQRLFRESGTGDRDFGMRIRYRLAAAIPLNKPDMGIKTLYLPLGAEWFFDLGGETPEFFAAQSRLTTGLGYVISDNWSLEFRYTAQRSRDTVLDEFATTDHILDLRIRTTLRIRDWSTPW